VQAHCNTELAETFFVRLLGDDVPEVTPTDTRWSSGAAMRELNVLSPDSNDDSELGNFDACTPASRTFTARPTPLSPPSDKASSPERCSAGRQPYTR